MMKIDGWTFFLLGILVGCISVAILHYQETSELEDQQMCFSLEQGDLMQGVYSYCQYIDNDCWHGFINWSNGRGLYWNNKSEVENG